VREGIENRAHVGSARDQPYELDSALLARPRNDEIQLDPFFLLRGAKAFERENPSAEVRFYDAGPFALETHAAEIASAIGGFLARALTSQTNAA
jgi:hypothetical protein